MLMQHEIVDEGLLLDKKGRVTEPGWSRTEVLKYNRENIHAPWFRRKEWDYYLFNNDSIAVALTISDLGYIGLLSASFIDLKTGTEHTNSELGAFPMGKRYQLGTGVADGYARCRTKKLKMSFNVLGYDTPDALIEDHKLYGAELRPFKGLRRLCCEYKNFDGDKDLKVDLFVYEEDMEAVYIATPWKEKPTAFYYNCKKNCLTCEGTITYGDRVEHFERSNSAGVLDWGRGVWTYDNTWFWGTGSGYTGGELFGFNLGYGFSDRSSASENAIYYKGKIHKLEDVEFIIPCDSEGKRKYTDTWSIRSNNDCFEGEFKPILDRSACMNFGVIVSDQHQVFGRMTGYAVTSDGERVEFKDFICALEVVRNKY